MNNNNSTREAVIASNVLLCAFVAGLAINFFTKTGFFSPGGLPFPIWIPLIILGIVRFLFYKVKQGKLWAKILCAIIIGFALIGSLVDLVRITRSHLSIVSAPERINVILQFVLLVIMAAAVAYSFRRSKPTTSISVDI
ncbi:hypothetical protein [Hymenobacter daeguensis]